MSSYRETNDEPDTFYVDTFQAGQQLEIIEVIRQSGGQVEYDRAARHLGEARARYHITLSAGCEFAGLDEPMAPQTITLPGGPNMRKLCLYPSEDRVHIAWLPGDSADSSLWNGAWRKPGYILETVEENVAAEGAERQPQDVVTPHLQLLLTGIPEQTTRFAEELAKFLEHQEGGVPWLRIDTLRMVAQHLKQSYEVVDGLLAILEKRFNKDEESF